MKKRIGRKRPWILISQLGLLAIFLLLIQLAVDEGWVSSLYLTSPTQFVGSLWEMFSTGMIWEHIGISMQEYIIGFGLSIFSGILLGILVSNHRIFDDFTRPFFAAIMSVPKVALLPLLIIWFGIGLVSTVILIFIFCFFTIFYNTVSGIKQTPASYLKVARVFEATNLQITWKVQLPSAMPTIFAGIRVAASVGFIGTIFSEMQASRGGIGNLLQRASSLYKTDDLFAIVALATVLSVGMIKLIDLIEKHVVLKYKLHN
jgi:NitT/TauT family transport system permease protein